MNDSPATVTSPPQLSAQVVNRGSHVTVDNVIYIAPNTTANQVDLQVMISSGKSTLVPGDVVAPEQLPPTGNETVLYLDLSPLSLTAAAWTKLAPAAEGWNCVVYAADQVVGMAPSKAAVLAQGSPVVIHLTGLELDQAPASQTPQLSVTYFNVPGVTTGKTSWVANFSVAVQNPPEGDADLTQVLAVTLESNQVVNSYDSPTTTANTLTLMFSQTPAGVGVPAGAETLFTVSFVYGQDDDPFGYGALTTVASARDIKPAKGDNADEWVPTSNTSAESPNWTLKPPTGQPIAGTGVEAVTSFTFAPIVTTYQPGPTVMLVQYKGVPGYRGGVYTLVLDKLPHVVVGPVTVTPPVTYLHDGQADVTVAWDVSYAKQLQLTQNFQPFDVTGLTSKPITLTAQLTSFRLDATGLGTNVDNQASGSARVIALPVINSFAGQPTDVYSGSGSHDVDLAWAVDTTGKVALSSTGGDISGSDYDATGNTSGTVHKPQLVTLAPVADPGVTAPSRSLVIDAFTTAVQNHPLSATSSAAAASPSAPFVAVADPSNGQVVILDTVQFSPVTTVPVMASPTGVVFSPDGSLMVTLGGDATVALHQVALSGGLPTFTSQGSVSLTDNPGGAVVTPDLSRIYLSVDGHPGSVVGLAKGAHGYAAHWSVAVGNGPRGLAADPSGSRLYVANSADSSVSVVGIGLDGTLEVTATAQGVSQQPTGLAVTSDGSTLLAACSGNATVWAIDTANPGTGRRQQLTVGASPVQVAVTPSGAYAFVANSGDGTVSLLDVWSGATACQVLEKAMAVGKQPSGVAVSPDGLTVLVPDSGGPSLGVIALQTYTAAAVATDVGSTPTDIVVSSDSKAALIWHNSQLSTGQPVPGVRYYPLASGVATDILTDVAMVACVFAPGPGGTGKGHTAYAIGSAEPLLYLLDLTDPANPNETDIPLPVRARTMALAVTSDGSTVLVVVQDQTQEYTLLVGSVTAAGAWTATQSLPLYKGTWPGVVRAALSPDGATLLLADTGNHTLTVVTRSTKGVYAVHSPGLGITDAVNVSFLPDGSKAFVLEGSSPNKVTVLDLPTLQAETASVLQGYVNLKQLVPSPDGRRLYAADTSAAALRILDAASLRILQTLPLAPQVSQAQGASGTAMAPDGSHVFVANTISSTVSVLQQVSM